MNQGTVRASGLTIAGAYLFFVILMVWPMVDLSATGWPFRPGSLEWRYGFLGLMAAYWHTPILGLILSMGLSFVLGHRKTLRLLSVFAVLWAVALLVVIILFPLDVIQLRSVTPEENLAQLQMGGILTELKHFTAFLAVLLLGWGGWKTAGNLPKSTRSGEGSKITAEVIAAQKRD